MIEALFDIGKIQHKGNFLDEFIEDVGDQYKHVFKVVFDIENQESPFYVGIDYEEFSKSKKLQYFYKGVKGNAVNYTPTAKITNIQKTFKTKIANSIGNFLDKNRTSIEDVGGKLLRRIDDIIRANNNKIIDDLTNYAKKLNLLTDKNTIKDGGIITVCFIRNKKELYIGDLDVFVQTFLRQQNEAYRSYYYKYEVESRSKDKQCYLCRKTTEVWGFVDTYKFYTADKKGMVTGGFNQKEAWKNYPVCPECAITLDRGKRYVENWLSYKFCGFNYFVIPQLVYPNDDILSQTLIRMQNYDNFSLGTNRSALIEKTEEKIIRDLSKEKDVVNFNFVFYKRNNSAFNILLHLKEIAPSRLAYLIKIKDEVDSLDGDIDIFREIATKKGAIKFDFSFQLIRNFFTNSKIEGDFDKEFLSIINNIFIGKRISLEFLLNRIMSKIRGEFLNEKAFNINTLKAYKIVIYLEKINLLTRGRFDVSEIENRYEKFFSENVIFDDNAKKALFLEGVLAGKLLNIQYRERNAAPFRSRLNGLKIDERVAKRLFPEIINKLEEYDKNYYKKMEEAIGIYFVNSNFAKYSVDELSFYFNLGLSLNGKFEKKENEEEENE